MNHVLMHVVSVVVAMVLLAGTFVVEKRETILSIFLPLLTFAWAAATVRFDFFIHRQGAYLRSLEAHLAQNVSTPLWETWKYSNRAATSLVVPVLDVIVVLAILIPTFFILFGPCRKFFDSRGLKGAKAYAWTLSVMIVGLLLSLGLVPFVF